jgi:two-component system copper resistance phosphate regulon response regulator CusR
MTRVLIAEDEPGIASFLKRGFEAEGFTAKIAERGDLALSLVQTGEFDLLILDIGLPEVDGFTVLSELRRGGRDIPVLILTARDSVEDTVAGLDAGADDYVTKPFRFEELLARARARLRPERTQEAEVITVGEASLDLRTRRAQVEGKMVELTAREFALAKLFFANPGQVLSKEQILSHVWGYDFDPASNVVEVYVSYLRRKLGGDRLVTVRGMGYKLESS